MKILVASWQFRASHNPNLQTKREMAAPVRSVGRLMPSSTALFLCDMQVLNQNPIMSSPFCTARMDFQVKFRPMISHFDEVVSNSSRVLDAAKIMSLPCLATEQYPKGLGPTVDELGLAKHSVTAFPKTCFTMVIPEILEALKTQQEETKWVKYTSLTFLVKIKMFLILLPGR